MEGISNIGLTGMLARTGLSWDKLLSASKKLKEMNYGKPPLIGLHHNCTALIFDCRTCQQCKTPGQNGRQTKNSPAGESPAGLFLIVDLISELLKVVNW